MLLIELFANPLDTIQYHKTLNPKLWDGSSIRPEVKDKLKEIADTFFEYLELPELEVLDILFTGSNANYNYTPMSDIDIHLKVDLDSIKCPNLADNLFNAKKTLFNLKHDIKIRGFNVELYVENISNPVSAAGIYSIMNDRWISKPSYKNITINDAAVLAKVEDYKDAIDRAISDNVDIDEAQSIKDKIRIMRKAGLSKGGEYSVENLTFKVLRNIGYLDKLTDYINSNQDKELSLEAKDQAV